MLGNVWEWTIGKDGEQFESIRRGGSWGDTPYLSKRWLESCLVDGRHTNCQKEAWYGFRCAGEAMGQ